MPLLQRNAVLSIQLQLAGRESQPLPFRWPVLVDMLGGSHMDLL